jgi:hypothetical protein
MQTRRILPMRSIREQGTTIKCPTHPNNITNRSAVVARVYGVDSPRCVYHGTSAARAASIARDGFRSAARQVWQGHLHRGRRLFPLHLEPPSIIKEGARHHPAAHQKPGSLLVTDGPVAHLFYAWATRAGAIFNNIKATLADGDDQRFPSSHTIEHLTEIMQ